MMHDGVAGTAGAENVRVADIAELLLERQASKAGSAAAPGTAEQA
jgi:hypothetical protein